MKATRYYRLEDGMLCIYDTPYADVSVSVSIARLEDMPYYRNNYRMIKLVGDVCPKEYR